MPMTYALAQYGHPDGKSINCVITDHPEYPGIPYTAVENADDEFGRLVWAELQHVPVAAYVAPAPYVPQVVEKVQLVRALRDLQIWAHIKANMAALASADDLEDWELSTSIHRHHPVIVAVGTALGMNAEALDALFINAATK